ncbi:hypothetical protein ACFQ1S_41470 [Kibdelosporangium lantanae]|uniref:Uncharacterized protein n=1 Tax=Kibdelosporangium lantanae TaxID=1497396 RepID=A0ABW3MN50_9PSEU
MKASPSCSPVDGWNKRAIPSVVRVTIRELSRQRRQVVRALVAQVRSLALEEDQKIGDTVLRDIESVFTSALSDPAVTTTLMAGTLANVHDLTTAEGWPETPAPVVDLRFQFTLRAGRIAELVIEP